MTQALDLKAALAIARTRLEAQGISVVSVASSSFPEETVIRVVVRQSSFDRAIELAPSLDRELQDGGFNGFVTIRPGEGPANEGNAATGVHDFRIPAFIELLTTRSRTSETHPSLFYVPDAAANASLITAARHHLVFGRRGAGKTALLLEGKRIAETNDAIVVWSNVQTYRDLRAEDVFLWIAEEVVGVLQS